MKASDIEKLKILLERSIPIAEYIANSDFDLIKDEDPELYSELIELQEIWDSPEVTDSLEAWEEIRK